MTQILINKGQIVKIAQDAILNEYSKAEKTLYYRERVEKPIIAIYLRPFAEYNEHLCEIIVGDKILYTDKASLRILGNK